MKIKSYNILFRLFSYLADKTNGTPFFVKYKLILGSLIIGLTGASCNNSKQSVTCYDISPVDSGLIQTAKQDSVDSTKEDSSQKVIQIRTIRPVILPPEESVSCYVVIPPVTEDTIQENEPTESEN